MKRIILALLLMAGVANGATTWADFDETLPANTTRWDLGDDYIRTNWSAILDNLTITANQIVIGNDANALRGDPDLVWDSNSLDVIGAIDVTGNITVSGTVDGVDVSSAVTKVGTPVDNQIGVWTGDGTIEGDAGLTWDGTSLYLSDDGDQYITATSSTNTIRVSVDGANNAFFDYDPNAVFRIIPNGGQTSSIQLWNTGTGVTADESCGTYEFWGDENDGDAAAGIIEARSVGSWDANDKPSRMFFKTNDYTGSSTPAERMHLDEDGMDVTGNIVGDSVLPDDGVSGTLVMDDGTTERITLVFTSGILTSRTVAASSGSLIDWTD